MMKKSVIAVLVVVCMCIATFQPSSALTASAAVGTGDEVIKNDKTGIPDKALYQCILDELEKKKTETFTRQEAMGLSHLEVSIDHGAVKSLKGIGYLANLESLDLGGLLLTNIREVGELKKLKSLNLEYNKVRSLKELSGLTELQCLYVPSNRLASLDGVEKLKKLQVLDAMDNHLTDASQVKTLKNLEKLYLGGNALKDISFVKKLTKLKGLWVEDNRLTNIDGVKDLKNLRELCVRDNRIKKLPNMKKLTKLKYYSCVLINNMLTEKELRSKLPAHLLKKSKAKKEWLAEQITLQDNFKITLLSPKSKGQITKNTKKITGRTHPGARVELQNLRTKEKIKRVTANKYGEFTLKNLNLKKWAGDKAALNVYIKRSGKWRLSDDKIEFHIKK